METETALPNRRDDLPLRDIKLWAHVKRTNRPDQCRHRHAWHTTPYSWLTEEQKKATQQDLNSLVERHNSQGYPTIEVGQVYCPRCKLVFHDEASLEQTQQQYIRTALKLDTL